MAQHTQINECNTTQKQNQGQKPHNHLNRCMKSLQNNWEKKEHSSTL
jgi:hypothetical protein